MKHLGIFCEEGIARVHNSRDLAAIDTSTPHVILECDTELMRSIVQWQTDILPLWQMQLCLQSGQRTRCKVISFPNVLMWMEWEVIKG